VKDERRGMIMKKNIYEQLLFELNEEKKLIDRKKIMLGFLWNELTNYKISDSTQLDILSAMTSIGLSKDQDEVERYSENIFYHIERKKMKREILKEMKRGVMK
jgi:hypothetical protein